MKILRIFVFALLATSLSACNTVHGLGKDIEKAGEAIQKGSSK